MNGEKGKIRWKGEWDFYIPESGALVSEAEIEQLKRGEDIGRKVTHKHFTNVVTSAFRELVNDALLGDEPVDLVISHGQLGTGTTTAKESDTDLDTPDPSQKKAVSSKSKNGTALNITDLWDTGTATGTWKEYGVWVNSGKTLMIRVNIDIEVGATSPLTISGTVTQSYVSS